MRKYVFFLLLINIIVALAGYLVIMLAGLNMSFDAVLFLLAGFSVISFIMIAVFHRGQKKDPQSKVLYTLVALGLKFLLDLVLALIWFVVAKKTSSAYVFIFFVLYLTLTLFSVIYLMKSLRNK